MFADVKEALEIAPHTTMMIPTGVAMEIPDGYWGGVFARSGLASKEALRPANCVGVVDADYRGEVKVCLYNHSNEVQTISPNERIAQIIFTPFMQVNFLETDELTDTDRGTGGFGSTN